MTDPQWLAPGSGTPSGPESAHPGAQAAYGSPPGAPPAGAQPGYGPPPGGQRPPPRQPAMEFRPGVIPLRPLRLGDLYGAVVKAIRGNVAATMGLAFVTTLVFLVPTTALGAWIASLETADFTSSEAAFPVAGTLSSYVPALGTWLSSILLTGFVAWVIGQAVMGRRVTAGQTWEGTRGRLPQVIGATLVTSLALVLSLAAVLVLPVLAIVSAVQSGGESGVGAAVALGVVGALAAVVLVLFISTRLAFVTASVVLEQLGVGAGLARSWRLTGGTQFWRVLGIRVLTGVIVGFAAQILSIPLSILGVVGVLGTGDSADLFIWQAVTAGLSGLITGALTTPFTAGVDALLYVDQRIRREGFDVQLITAAQQDAARTWPGATGRP